MYLITVEPKEHLKAELSLIGMDKTKNYTVQTLEEAKEYRQHWTIKYPNAFNVKVFETNEVVFNDDLEVTALTEHLLHKVKTEYYAAQGFDSFVEYKDDKRTVYSK